jgi:hypothetical protein
VAMRAVKSIGYLFGDNPQSNDFVLISTAIIAYDET